MSSGTFDCLAVVAPGLELLAARELAALGLAPGEPEPGGVPFGTDVDGLQRANLELRTVSRVLVRMARFRARTFFELERRAGRLPWERFVAPGRAVELRVTSRKSKLYHQGAIAERLAAAVARAVPGAAGAAPAGDEDAPAPDRQRFVVRFLRDECLVSADSSGELLHRRGYRLATAKAPLRETLAAAMLLASGWDGARPLIDPMCGSGTIPIEAALLARRIPPGLARALAGAFAFQRWPGHEPDRFRRLVDDARAAIRERAPAPILGSDRDAGAVELARANAERAGVAGDVELRRAAVSAIDPPPAGGGGFVVSNPPYGVRVGERAALRDLYAQLGNVLRRRCPGWRLALLTARPELARQLRLPLAPVFVTANGGIPVRLVAGEVTGAETRPTA